MKKLSILIVFFICLLINCNVSAKTCEYEIDYILNKSGRVSEPPPAKKGGTIELTINADGTHKGIGKSNGGFLNENFGGKEEILNWGKSKNGVSAINNKECPAYIGVIVNWADREWYGFTIDTFSKESKKIADRDASDDISIFKWKELDELPDQEDSFSCEYNSFSIKVNLVINEIYVETNENMYSNIYIQVSDDLKNYWLNDRENKECVSLYLCNKPAFSNMNYFYLYKDKAAATQDGANIGSCSLECLKDDENCEKSDCPTLNKFTTDLREDYINYSESNDKSILIETNKLIDEYKSVCDNLLKHLNYNEPCALQCLTLNDYIKSEKLKYGIENEYPSTQCGLSGRLILFIGKVVKWMKYLVPVIVIVLSIIDFIKATGADKEDEIKKAQNKFIRRLIIAALIFIMPFIIEFVLNKMGFEASGCGIIDL